MERYNIELTKNALKSYKKLPKEYNSCRLSFIQIIRRSTIRYCFYKRRKNIYRIRIGKYRILFIKLNNTILIINIGTEGDIY